MRGGVAGGEEPPGNRPPPRRAANIVGFQFDLSGPTILTVISFSLKGKRRIDTYGW